MLGFPQKYWVLLHIPITCFSSYADTIRLNYRLVKGTDLNLETTQKKKPRGKFEEKQLPNDSRTFQANFATQAPLSANHSLNYIRDFQSDTVSPEGFTEAKKPKPLFTYSHKAIRDAKNFELRSSYIKPNSLCLFSVFRP